MQRIVKVTVALFFALNCSFGQKCDTAWKPIHAMDIELAGNTGALIGLEYEFLSGKLFENVRIGLRTGIGYGPIFKIISTPLLFEFVSNKKEDNHLEIDFGVVYEHTATFGPAYLRDDSGITFGIFYRYLAKKKRVSVRMGYAPTIYSSFAKGNFITDGKAFTLFYPGFSTIVIF